MQFPKTNKHPQGLVEATNDNAKLLEDFLGRVDWRKFLKIYAGIFGVILLSTFLIIVVIRLALFIF